MIERIDYLTRNIVGGQIHLINFEDYIETNTNPFQGLDMGKRPEFNLPSTREAEMIDCANSSIGNFLENNPSSRDIASEFHNADTNKTQLQKEIFNLINHLGFFIRLVPDEGNYNINEMTVMKKLTKGGYYMNANEVVDIIPKFRESVKKLFQLATDIVHELKRFKDEAATKFEKMLTLAAKGCAQNGGARFSAELLSILQSKA